MTLRLVLPLPPSVNHHYSHARGRVMLTGAARAYRQEVWVATREQTTAQERAALPERLAVTIRASGWRGDLDNMAKETLDALAAAIGFDDARVDWLLVERGEAGRRECDVTIEEAANGAS